MHIRKKHLPVLILMALLWLLALGFATVYDLDISLAIADKQSVYGRFFEIAGEPPAILFASFNFFLLMAYRLRCTEFTERDKLLAALFALLGVGTAFFTAIKTYDYILDWLDDLSVIFRLDLVFLLFTLLLACIICIVFIITALTIKEEKLKALYPIAKSCVLAAVFTFVIIWALKLTWGRVRFRGMYGDYSLFTPWYIINGYTGGFSFPSGHTANASVIFSAAHYLRFLPKKARWVKPIIYTSLVVWIAVVAFSRVCVGAHFLSDVLFGAAITLAIVYFTRPKEKV